MKGLGQQRHESVGQVLGLPKIAWSGERPAKSLGTRTRRALNALSPSASPEGSGEPQKTVEQGKGHGQSQQGRGSRSENHPWYQVWLRVLLGPNPSLESIQG